MEPTRGRYARTMVSLRDVPIVGVALRNKIMSPIDAAFWADRPAFEQYTDPPGEPGLFGPGSATWRVHAHPSMMVGGLAALMLQTLHPLALAGVHGHSTYREDPLGRLSRTGAFVTGTTFGSTETAERFIKLARGMHGRVRGTLPDGRTYSADDPALLTWVHLTEATCFLRAHQRYVPFPVRGAQADRYLDEMATIAVRLGAPAADVPRSRAAVRAYFQAVRPELDVSDQTRATMEFLTQPLPGSAAATAGHRLVVQAALGLLPAWARDMLGVERGSLSRTLTGAATYAMLATLRFADGPPPQLLEAQRRIATPPATVRPGPRTRTPRWSP